MIGDIKNYCGMLSEEQVVNFINSINDGFYIYVDEGSLVVNKIKFENENRFYFIVNYMDHAESRKVILTDLDAFIYDYPSHIADVYLAPNWRKFLGQIFPEYEEESSQFYENNEEAIKERLGIKV